jgi:type IX secretion system PorP/SprF family membrane protein
MDKELISMKNFNIKNFISFAVLLISMNSFAQQDALFTQYMYNMSVVNPAYATNTPGIVNFGGLYRTQWVGVEGAPRSGTFFAHSPLTEKVEAGISFVNDQIGGGTISQNNVFADFAYVLPVSDESKLSLGLKAGASFFNINAANLARNTQADASFADIGSVLPNIGVGAFYFHEKYYVGLSAPNLLQSTESTNVNGIKTVTQVKTVHYFLTAGYIFDLSPSLMYKPSFMFRSVMSAPVSFDINNNFLINEKLELGVGYRINTAVMGNVIFNINRGLRIGYAYDYSTNKLQKFNSGSHEIMVLFNLDALGQYGKYDKSPRFY